MLKVAIAIALVSFNSRPMQRARQQARRRNRPFITRLRPWLLIAALDFLAAHLLLGKLPANLTPKRRHAQPPCSLASACAHTSPQPPEMAATSDPSAQHHHPNVRT